LIERSGAVQIITAPDPVPGGSKNLRILRIRNTCKKNYACETVPLVEDGEDEEERLSGLSLEEQVQELVRQAQVILLDET
jgi:hypothetical protein